RLPAEPAVPPQPERPGSHPAHGEPAAYCSDRLPCGPTPPGQHAHAYAIAEDSAAHDELLFKCHGPTPALGRGAMIPSTRNKTSRSPIASRRRPLLVRGCAIAGIAAYGARGGAVTGMIQCWPIRKQPVNGEGEADAVSGRQPRDGVVDQQHGDEQ